MPRTLGFDDSEEIQPDPYESEHPPVDLRDLTKKHLARPSAARCYDVYLGGTHNFASDRIFVRKQRRVLPIIEDVARRNRGFLARATRHAAEAGIKQFIDLGCGVPTSPNVHEIAEEVAPGENKVIYVDNEPIALAHAERILKKTGVPGRHMTLAADLREPDHLWRKLKSLQPTDEEPNLVEIDWNEPVCLLLVAVLHFVPPKHEPERWMGRFRQILPPGSMLGLSHITADGVPPERVDQIERFVGNYSRTTNELCHRSWDEVRAFFGNMELVEPGLSWTVQWRNNEEMRTWPRHIDPGEACGVAGLGYKPDAKTF